MTSHRSALDLIRERAGAELAERIEHLDRVRKAPRRDEALPPPDSDASLDADVVFLGGGLSILVAAELARIGASVVVLERSRAGAAHREWNASAPELAPLVTAGLVTEEELDELIVARYREGICSFFGGAPRIVRGALDHAVDAGPLLERVRAVARSRGVRFVDHADVVGVGAGRSSVRVRFEEDGRPAEIVSRIVVDARGASSPHATADLVCPTVGGVFRGLEHDPEVGDILVTTEHADRGRQHVWEGFPGRPGDLTVYLFYYADAKAVPGGALLPLYARFFETLGSYKRGAPELVRPTFGYIPGWSRLTPAPASPSPRIVLVGDAAARHSPLTFCGFGSMLRTFQPVAANVARALERGDPPTAPLVAPEPVHAWTGLLAKLMATGRLEGDALNVLLDDAFASLEAMGNDTFAALLKDQTSARDFVAFLRLTAKRHPSVYGDVMKSLGPLPMARWGARLARSVLGAGA